MSRDATPADVLAGRARWCLVHGDNTTVLPTLPAKSVAHVVTDPPYEAEAHTLQRRVKRQDGDGENSRWGGADGRHAQLSPLVWADLRWRTGSVAAQLAKLASRWCVVFCQVEAVMKWQQALVEGGHVARRIGVWVKPDAMPQFSGDRPGMGYESIVFTHAKRRSTWNGGGRVGVFSHNKNSGGAHDHETQKPLDLMLELVSLFTDPDDVILDPFAGSGATGVACLRLGRRFIGVEKDATYAQVARDRLAAEVDGLSLRDARAGQTSIFQLLGADGGANE